MKCLSTYALCLIALADCTAAQSSAESSNPDQGFQWQFYALGTLVDLQAYGDPQTVEKAFKQAEERVKQLDSILTDYVPSSETRQLTELAFASETSVSPDLWTVIVASEEWWQKSSGALDCSLGALTSMWRKHRRVNRIPSNDEIREALEISGWRHVHLDRSRQEVRFDISGLRLDFGAIGKGYIVDEAFAVLRESGLKRVLVNVSGNMRAGDAPPGRPGWRVLLADPASRGASERSKKLDLSDQDVTSESGKAFIVVANTAIATSGDLWQFQLIDGQRRSHILSPTTGMGVLGPKSATVLAPTALCADALATVGCVAEPAAAMALAARENAAIRISVRDAEDAIHCHVTKGFPPLIPIEAGSQAGDVHKPSPKPTPN